MLLASTSVRFLPLERLAGLRPESRLAEFVLFLLVAAVIAGLFWMVTG